MESLFDELKRYVGFGAVDEETLRGLLPVVEPEFVRVADTFYRRILDHEEAKKALVGGESQVGHLKVTLVAWMELLFRGPWDEAYFELRCRIGRLHVRIALPQHYMFGAMNVIRRELCAFVDERNAGDPAQAQRGREAINRILDLELAIMLHTYREDLIAARSRDERLATFGQLVGSIGHELRNPLGVIESSLYILRGRVGDDPRTQKHMARIGEQLRAANDIVSTLLDMIRDRPLQREKVRLLSIVEAALGSLTAPAGVRVVVEGVAELPPVDADPTQLRQVLTNLVENAFHASPEGGEVRIAGARVAEGAPGPATETIALSVEDQGPGVDPAVRGRLFEPLVTTKTKGIGLGLALVKRIAERHGGRIAYVPASPKGGARFVLTLPSPAEAPRA